MKAHRISRHRWALLLLVVPFIGLVYPDWYARFQPALAGIPFFIWYQFAMVLFGAGVIGLVYGIEQWQRVD